MFDTFIGVVQGSSEEQIAVGILDTATHTIASRSFSIQRTHFDTYTFLSTNGRLALHPMEDLAPLADYLNIKIRNPRSVRISLEVPGLYGYAPKGANPVPVLFTALDSIYLKLLMFLYFRGYIAAMFLFNQERTQAIFQLLPSTPEYAQLRLIQPKYLDPGVSKAYGDILLGASDTPEKAAVIAALIAKNRGAYYFWSSFGMVQSSADVVNDLRSDYEGPTGVISAGEWYVLVRHDQTKRDDLKKISLEYALASKRYEALHENNRLKAALLHVCKKWRITLRCISDREDADEADKKNFNRYHENIENTPLVYPLDAEDDWIIDSLRQSEPDH